MYRLSLYAVPRPNPIMRPQALSRFIGFCRTLWGRYRSVRIPQTPMKSIVRARPPQKNLAPRCIVLHAQPVFYADIAIREKL